VGGGPYKKKKKTKKSIYEILTCRRLLNEGAEPRVADLLPRPFHVEYLKLCTMLCYHMEKLVRSEARNLEDSELAAGCQATNAGNDFVLEHRKSFLEKKSEVVEKKSGTVT
jgi:hypothetical protein